MTRRTTVLLILSLLTAAVYLLIVYRALSSIEITQTEYVTDVVTVERIVTVEKVVYVEVESASETANPTLTYAGTFKCTAYSSDYACCGKYPDDPAYGITASGTTAAEGRTIAADWSVLPVGTVVYIEGVGYRTVEDTGGAIQWYNIDLYFESYDDALNYGRRELNLWVLS